MSRQKVRLDQLIVPTGAEPGDVPTVSGGELVLAPPPTGGGSGSGGSLVLLDTTELVSPAASITLTVPSGYQHLRLSILGRCDSTAAVQRYLYASFNGDTSDANYYSNRLASLSSGSAVSSANGTSSSRTVGIIASATATAGFASCLDVEILNYSDTTWYKTAMCRSAGLGGSSLQHLTALGWKSTAAITSIQLTEEGGANFVAGTKAWLYGVS